MDPNAPEPRPLEEPVEHIPELRPPAPGSNTQDDIVFGIAWVLVILASILLSPSSGGVSIAGWELPPLCLWNAITGFRCPGCGLTRSFTFMGHVQPVEAFQIHWLGPPLYLLMVGDLLRRGWRLWRTLRSRREP